MSQASSRCTYGSNASDPLSPRASDYSRDSKFSRNGFSSASSVSNYSRHSNPYRGVQRPQLRDYGVEQHPHQQHHLLGLPFEESTQAFRSHGLPEPQGFRERPWNRQYRPTEVIENGFSWRHSLVHEPPAHALHKYSLVDSPPVHDFDKYHSTPQGRRMVPEQARLQSHGSGFSHRRPYTASPTFGDREEAYTPSRLINREGSVRLQRGIDPPVQQMVHAEAGGWLRGSGLLSEVAAAGARFPGALIHGGASRRPPSIYR